MSYCCPSALHRPCTAAEEVVPKWESETSRLRNEAALAAIDHGLTTLVKDYGLSIDVIAGSLARFHASGYTLKSISLKDCGFLIDESSVNFAEFHASLCRQGKVQVTDDDHLNLLVENTLLLLNESCKLVSKNLQDDVLLERLNEHEFKAIRACIELEEMEKEMSVRPVLMRAYATQELKEVEGWFRSLLNKWKQISLDPIVELLEKISGELDSRSSSYASDAMNAIEHVLHKLDELGNHPVFRGILSVKRDHVAQVASTVEGKPASWLDLFSMPPLLKTSALMKKFTGQKQALAAVSYGLRRRRNDHSQVHKPVGSFLVVDPSGQYWEEFARALSQLLFDTSDVSLRIALSESFGSTSGRGRDDNLGKLFEGVRRRPYGIVIFEKIEHAKYSDVCILNQVLRTGYASDEGGSTTDFTKSVILIILQGLSPFAMGPCPCIQMLQHSPFKSYLSVSSSSSAAQSGCQCVDMLKEARKQVDAETWELVDDVALFGSQFYSYLSAYGRCILREMAGDFCHGRLILYPSEALLRIIWADANNVNGEKAMKSGLEKHVRPVLEDLAKNGIINENSVILVDNNVGTGEMVYMIENREDHCRGARARKFRNWAAFLRLAYEKGKYLEQLIGCLVKKLSSFSKEVIPLTGTEAVGVRKAIEELITKTGEALCAAKDLKIVKEALGSPAEETDDVMALGLSAAVELESVKEDLGSPVGDTEDLNRASKRLKTRLDASASGVESSSAWPEIIAAVEQALKLRRCSAASFLLLGLRDDVKKELLNELVSCIADGGVVKIFAIDMSEYSDESSLFHLKNSPMRTFSNSTENLNLVEAVRKHPYSIFYFDKIEKAHISVYGLLLSLLRYGVLTDNQGSDVDFRGTVVIFGSDNGNKDALAQLAGHDSKVNSISEAGNGQEKEESKACRFRFELLIKVDKLVVFNPFAMHQLKSMRSYEVEELRRCEMGSDFKEWFSIFLFLFVEGEVSKLPEKLLERIRPYKEMLAQQCNQSEEWLVGWLPSVLPDPFLRSYQFYLSQMPLV